MMVNGERCGCGRDLTIIQIHLFTAGHRPFRTPSSPSDSRPHHIPEQTIVVLVSAQWRPLCALTDSVHHLLSAHLPRLSCIADCSISRTALSQLQHR